MKFNDIDATRFYKGIAGGKTQQDWQICLMTCELWGMIDTSGMPEESKIRIFEHVERMLRAQRAAAH